MKIDNAIGPVLLAPTAEMRVIEFSVYRQKQRVKKPKQTNVQPDRFDLSLKRFDSYFLKLK